jgi:2-methylaconitate cis-trans-isomerase PrpF
MLIAVGPYAIEQGLVPAQDPETTVRVYNVNTRSLIEVIVQTPGRRVEYEGDAAIDGVPGTAAPVKLNFKGGAGAVTGKLLPTGHPLDVIDGIEVSCVDMAMPIAIMSAAAFGKSGYETPAELDADKKLMARMESVRIKAGVLMGMGDVTKLVVPKVALLAPPRHGGTVSSRYFVPYACHENHAVTGAICVASACAIEGTVAATIAPLGKPPQGVVGIEHPAGILSLDLDIDFSKPEPVMRRAALIRTARRLFQGEALIPSSVWSQDVRNQRRAAA